MSSRTYMLAVESIEPIRQAIGSADQAILDGIAANLDREKPHHLEYAQSMIMSARPKKEPGCWNYLVKPLAQHLGLAVEQLPMDDWKHYAVWEEYRKIVDPQVSAEALDLLKMLAGGRPFQGTTINHDGCVFAWLSTAEAAQLLDALAPVEIDEDDDLADFHRELTSSLQFVVTNKMDLFAGAH